MAIMLIMVWVRVVSRGVVPIAAVSVRIGADQVGATLIGSTFGVLVPSGLNLGHTSGKALDRGYDLGQGLLDCFCHLVGLVPAKNKQKVRKHTMEMIN